MMTITNYAKITIFFLADVLLNSYISDVMIWISTSRFGIFLYSRAKFLQCGDVKFSSADSACESLERLAGAVRQRLTTLGCSSGNDNDRYI